LLTIALVLGTASLDTRVRAQPAGGLDPELSALAFKRAAELPKLQALIVARHGVIQAERRFRGPRLDAPVNVKSISKSIMSALIGIAIERGDLSGVDQPIAPFFAKYVRRNPDPRLRQITIGQLLSMQSGLTRTSGPSYAPWTSSKNWVEYILTAPLQAEPGGPMVYSTGNTHLLSALLTQASRTSTYEFAREHLAKPLGIKLLPWARDPQGIYFGGNQMRLSARALLQFGELYRNRGKRGDRQIIPADWIDQSLQPRARSIFSGQLYGYGWFLSSIGDHPLFYAWGYGGQFIFVLPDLEMTVVATSTASGPRDFEHLGALYDLLGSELVPAAERASHAGPS
jgi:CubicO group peptidase (beta-lactamase class C family)